MKLSKKYVYIALALIFVASLAGTFGVLDFVRINAESRSIDLPLKDATKMDMFSYRDKFIAVMADDSHTIAYALDSESDSRFERLCSIDGKYAAANLAGNKLFVSSNNTNDSVKVVSYELDTETSSSFLPRHMRH